jgi:flagellin-like hook-associated protein FlgL
MLSRFLLLIVIMFIELKKDGIIVQGSKVISVSIETNLKDKSIIAIQKEIDEIKQSIDNIEKSAINVEKKLNKIQNEQAKLKRNEANLESVKNSKDFKLSIMLCTSSYSNDQLTVEFDTIDEALTEYKRIFNELNSVS